MARMVAWLVGGCVGDNQASELVDLHNSLVQECLGACVPRFIMELNQARVSINKQGVNYTLTQTQFIRTTRQYSMQVSLDDDLIKY